MGKQKAIKSHSSCGNKTQRKFQKKIFDFIPYLKKTLQRQIEIVFCCSHFFSGQETKHHDKNLIQIRQKKKHEQRKIWRIQSFWTLWGFFKKKGKKLFQKSLFFLFIFAEKNFYGFYETVMRWSTKRFKTRFG